MSAEAYRDEEMYRGEEPDVISIKRNPYLVNYEQQRRLREQRSPQRQRTQRVQGTPQKAQRTTRSAQEMDWGQEIRRMSPQEQEMRRAPRRPSGEGQAVRRAPRRPTEEDQVIRRAPQGAQRVRQAQQYGGMTQPETMRRGNIDLYGGDNVLAQAQRKRAAMERKRAAVRRKRIVKLQRLVLFTGVFCIALLCGILFMKRMDAGATEPNQEQQQKTTGEILPAASSGLVQGLPSDEYAKHPDWEENFLTINEYSRPGEALEQVNSIFVHYTANPNTSAAQNRSYFEQLKDTHITSASAHFIIGYNGEILQCIPLDEIAYAVQTRNYDSISIECCYKAADGSFTQETYDSLVELLAWLTDVYDLTTDDILRHYDCGGKKCPIYYTQHEDAWEQLKKDVTEKL